MEFLRNFIKNGYLKAIGKMDEYKIVLGASAYFDKGILTEDDLVEINTAIEEYYNKQEETVTEVSEEPVEEVVNEEVVNEETNNEEEPTEVEE